MKKTTWKAHHIRRIVDSNNLRPASICEVGCGAGEIIKLLHEYYDSEVPCWGYEISPDAHAISAKKSQETLIYVLDDALTAPDKAFDLVLAIDVMEHVDDYLGFLRELRRIGRHVVLHIPLDLSAQRMWRIDAILDARRTLGHLHYFTKETALATLDYAGFEIIDWFYTASALDLSPKTLRNRVVNMPRRIFYRLNPDLAARTLGGFSIMVLAK